MHQTDEYAKSMAIEKFALPPCLHIPIAARDEASILKYIGVIRKVLVTGKPNMAFLVEPHRPPTIDKRLPIWDLPESVVLHSRKQVWVQVDYTEYRKAYLRVFPEQETHDIVLDHIMNRRVARLKGFSYLRIVPISREANSSSGGLSEKWAADYHSMPEMQKVNADNLSSIQYADLADIVKMLDMKTGGALQDPVNLAQALVKE